MAGRLNALERLARPLGGWLSVLVWRLFGLALVLVWAQSMRPNLIEGLARSPASLDALALGGAALALAGPSLVVLGLTTAAALWFVYELLGAQLFEFVADEFIVHAAVPALGFALALVAVVQTRGDSDRRRDEVVELAHLRLFRVMVFTVLLFAGLHKLNSDFFDPSVSCARLGERLSMWSVPVPAVGPAGVVALELGSAVALLAYPRLGIALTVLTMTSMAHIGPAGFATTVVVLALGFSSPADRRQVQALFVRRGLQLALAAAFVVIISFTLYDGPDPWIRFGVFEVVALAVLAVAVEVGLSRARQRIRSGGWRALVQPAFVGWWRRRAKLPSPGLTSWLLILTLVNGASPYLGFKFRLSTAMLSNLRVDDAVWNSYVVPSAVSLRGHDPYIHVEWVEWDEWASASGPRRRGGFAPGLYQREAFLEMLEQDMRKKPRGVLTLTYAGHERSFDMPAAYLEVRAWAEGKPQSVLFRDHLGPPGQAQACTH